MQTTVSKVLKMMSYLCVVYLFIIGFLMFKVDSQKEEIIKLQEKIEMYEVDK